ncbi:glycosyltransferase, partial [Synechococcus sp. UW140]|uniref:glycosyltransferase n=1 Tax=Synechococcus sp. UW140 TaxID=368503 RepID=UPI0025DB9195
MTPKVCIGISIYKQPSVWIEESINSVLNQTEKDWQLLIRIDGPDAIQDKQAALLANYHEHSSKIKLIIGEKRLGTFGSYKEIFNQCDSK